MRLTLAFSLAFAVVAVSLADPQWESYKKALSPGVYNPKQESYYKTRYLAAVARANENNERYNKNKAGFKLKVNEYSFLAPNEFRRYRTGRKPNTKKGDKYKRGLKGKVPDSLDYEMLGLTTSVKNQGLCGCCYSFSTAAVIEGQILKRKKKSINLSCQQIIDCASDNPRYGCDGCDGGVEIGVFQYIKDAGGIQDYDSYPYVHNRTTCQANKNKVQAKVIGYKRYTNLKIDEVKELLVNVGPLCAGMHVLEDNALINDYAGGGVYEDSTCPNKLDELNHAVTLVGWGKYKGKAYWKVKNSWGPNWGERGYLLLSMDHDCGITADISFPLMG